MNCKSKKVIILGESNLLGFKMQVLSAVNNFFFGASVKYEPAKIDPSVQKILDVFYKCKESRDLLAEINTICPDFTVIPLNTKEEVISKNITRSNLTYTKGFVFYQYKFEILYDATLSFEIQLQSVLMECCNLTRFREFIELSDRAKAGKIIKSDTYAFAKEAIEFQAYKRYIKIGQAIESQGLAAPKSIISEDEILQGKSLSEYLNAVKSSDHYSRYELQFKAIKPQH